MSDRASRLRSKRKEVKEEASGTAETSEPSKTSKQSETEDTSETDKTSVKDERIGTYLYLSEEQRRELRLRYKVLSAEYESETGEELEKNRHFYPLVVQYGLDGLESSDAQDVREMLDGLSD